jgi:hypothetical protein
MSEVPYFLLVSRFSVNQLGYIRKLKAMLQAYLELNECDLGSL